jgi:hypothetical protein
MHYGNSLIKYDQAFQVAIYKHETNFKPRRNKYGFLTRSCVWYQVTSIRRCKFFPIHLVENILKDPYDFVNEVLSDAPYDNWFLVEFHTSEKGYNLRPLRSFDVSNVTNSKSDDTLFLH